jgi:3-deoxy-manno-octulosonate cytidylyltransferase (CMP-KDO synthetase)
MNLSGLKSQKNMTRAADETNRQKQLKIIAVIPARMNSSRFPGKPLALIGGLPMVEHVRRRASMCERLDAVYVATCDAEIKAAVERFGGEVIMTSPLHERASDRVAEAAENMDADIIVMIQGDEPMITPQMIDAALSPMLEDVSIECVNLTRRIETREEYLNRNTIKVVMNRAGNALYFSRSPIPAIDFDAAGDAPIFKQVCVIPFRRDFLRKFAALPPTPLERIESVDMLRAVEHGRRIRLVEIFDDTHAVDTPADLRWVEELMKTDVLISRYDENQIRGAFLR